MMTNGAGPGPRATARAGLDACSSWSANQAEDIMSLQTVGTQLVQMCNQGKNFDVMNLLYAQDIVSVEADGDQTSGKAAVIEKSKRWSAVNKVESEKMDGPFFNGPNEFAVHTVFEVTPKSTGKRVRLEEVGIYTVKNDQIIREQFFYAGER
jgi:hypothetical protein